MPRIKNKKPVKDAVSQALLRFCQRQMRAAYRQFKIEIDALARQKQLLLQQTARQSDLKKAAAIVAGLKKGAK